MLVRGQSLWSIHKLILTNPKALSQHKRTAVTEIWSGIEWCPCLRSVICVHCNTQKSPALKNWELHVAVPTCFTMTQSVSNPTSPSHYSRRSLIFLETCPKFHINFNYFSEACDYQCFIAVCEGDAVVEGVLLDLTSTKTLVLSSSAQPMSNQKKSFCSFYHHKVISLSIISTRRANNDLWLCFFFPPLMQLCYSEVFTLSV